MIFKQKVSDVVARYEKRNINIGKCLLPKILMAAFAQRAVGNRFFLLCNDSKSYTTLMLPVLLHFFFLILCKDNILIQRINPNAEIYAG